MRLQNCLTLYEDILICGIACLVRDIRRNKQEIQYGYGLIMATVPFLHDAPSTITKCIRGWKGFDREALMVALMEVPAIADPSSLAAMTLEEAFVHYEAAVGGVIDRLLPIHVVTIRQCPSSPWFDKECRTLRRQARRHERKFRRTRMPSDRSTWVQFVR